MFYAFVFVHQYEGYIVRFTRFPEKKLATAFKCSVFLSSTLYKNHDSEAVCTTLYLRMLFAIPTPSLFARLARFARFASFSSFSSFDVHLGLLNPRKDFLKKGFVLRSVLSQPLIHCLHLLALNCFRGGR